MVIFNIAPRQWGKTYKCVETFKYMLLQELHPMMLTINNSEKNDIIRDHELLQGIEKDIYSSLIQAPTQTLLRGFIPNFLIIDEYSKLSQSTKEKVYEIYKTGKINILIWSSPDKDYNKVTIMNIRNNKKKGIFIPSNPLSFDLITEPSTSVFLYSRRNIEFNPNDWLLEHKDWFHGVKELFDFDIDIEKVFEIVNTNGTVLNS